MEAYPHRGARGCLLWRDAVGDRADARPDGRAGAHQVLGPGTDVIDRARVGAAARRDQGRRQWPFPRTPEQFPEHRNNRSAAVRMALRWAVPLWLPRVSMPTDRPGAGSARDPLQQERPLRSSCASAHPARAPAGARPLIPAAQGGSPPSPGPVHDHRPSGGDRVLVPSPAGAAAGDVGPPCPGRRVGSRTTDPWGEAPQRAAAAPGPRAPRSARLAGAWSFLPAWRRELGWWERVAQGSDPVPCDLGRGRAPGCRG